VAVGTPARSAPLADRLNYLFDTVRRPDGKPYTNQEVAEAITASGTTHLSHNYLHQLRNGSRGLTGRTSRDKLHAIAEFFGRPPAYFDDPALAARADAQADLLALLRDHGVRQVATHAAGLPPAFLDAVVTLLQQTRAALGLPPITPPGPDVPAQRAHS
jgi:transcriptional regulator with XRE-family HTH domain